MYRCLAGNRICWRRPNLLALRLAVGLVLVAFTGPVSAQSSQTLSVSPTSQENTSAPAKYWLFFRDKPAVSGKQATVELTEQAVARRETRSTRVDHRLDRPVSTKYLDVLSRRNIEVIVQSRWLNAVSVLLSPSDVDELSRLDFISEIRPVGVAHTNQPAVIEDGTNVELYSSDVSSQLLSALETRIDYGPSQTQLQIMNAIDPIERGYIGTGVTIGFLDTEFDTLTHPVFAQLKADDRLIGSKFFTPGPQTNRHGVSVASVAVGFADGQLIGPAYGANVLLATTEFAPTETNQEEDAFVAGIEWLESQGVDVVNTSLGYTEFDFGQNSYTYADLDGNTGITTRVADIAVSLGVVVVTSAGNSGTLPWRYIGTPADADSVITVGAIDSNGIKASFSSFGPTADGRTKPEVAAMGRATYVATPGGYGASNGTSFSSPLVAAVACQILQANPDLTPVQVRQILIDTASQSDAPDNNLGYGIVNAGAAVDRALALVVDVDTDAYELVTELSLAPPYPNPTNSVTSVVVFANDHQPVSISIFDLLGRRAQRLPDVLADPDGTVVSIPTTNLRSGIYTIRAESAASSATTRLTVIH